MSKKITKATLKSFIKNNKENLLIRNKSDFNGAIDGLDFFKDSRFVKAKTTDSYLDCTLGIDGVWITTSRNYFEPYETETLKGIEVSNCCGNFILAVEK